MIIADNDDVLISSCLLEPATKDTTWAEVLQACLWCKFHEMLIQGTLRKARTLLTAASIDNFVKKGTMSGDESLSRAEYVQQQKKIYAALAPSEKRQLYASGKYFQVEEIDKWIDFAKRHNISAPEPLYQPNEALNDKISMWPGDITQLEIDAIVNAANASLMGGGGVDGAIHRAAGPDLKMECSLLNGCETGDAKITSGYKLPAKYVIHTVGPIGEKPTELASCYMRSLTLCRENSIRTVAFPCISTGIYGYPNEAAAHVVLKTVREWLEKEDNAKALDRIIFCLFLDVDKRLYMENMPKYFPVA